MIGRKERECGQIGAMTIAGTFGWTIEAPAAAAYAVLPVGVDMIRPGKEHMLNIQTVTLIRTICTAL